MRREAVSISLRQLREPAEATIRLPGTVNSLDIGSPPFVVDSALEGEGLPGLRQAGIFGRQIEKGPPMTAADILITNARVLTMDPARPKAEALAIAGNRIIRVGSQEGAQSLGKRPVNLGIDLHLP